MRRHALHIQSTPPNGTQVPCRAPCTRSCSYSYRFTYLVVGIFKYLFLLLQVLLRLCARFVIRGEPCILLGDNWNCIVTMYHPFQLDQQRTSKATYRYNVVHHKYKVHYLRPNPTTARSNKLVDPLGAAPDLTKTFPFSATPMTVLSLTSPRPLTLHGGVSGS